MKKEIENKFWFKKSGPGNRWGWPVTWQGYLISLGSFLLISWNFGRAYFSEGLLLGIVETIILAITISIIVYPKTEAYYLKHKK